MPAPYAPPRTGVPRLTPVLAKILIALTTFVFSSLSAPAQTANLVATPVNSNQRVELLGQRAPWALPEHIQNAMPGDTMFGHVMLVLKRSSQQQQAFEAFLRQLQEPSSPNYHHYLTPLQLGQEFGVSEYDIAAVCAWLTSQGLLVNSVSNSRMMIDFGGTASQIGSAFRTEMQYYSVNGERRIGPAGNPQIPAALAPVIQAVSGLYSVNDRTYHGAKQATVPLPAGSDTPAFTICDGGTCSHFVTPQDFSVIYNLGAVEVGGAGQTIAIIGRAEVYPPDIENFASLTGISLQPPNVILPPGGLDPGAPAGAGGTASGDQVEATIDVMRAGSVAPQANIDLVVSADGTGVNGIRVAAQYVVDSDPVIAQVMNVSFGACEADRTQADVDFWDSTFSQGAAEGISSFVASGDAGAAGCDTYFATPPTTQVLSPNYICSSSYSTCVGGTEFNDVSDPSLYWSQSNGGFLGSALSYIPEGGWNEPLNNEGDTQAAASGGGVSSYIATPSWQVGAGVPGTKGRYTPDIAFNSAAHDGYFGCLAAGGGSCVVDNGSFEFEYFFGTSCAAPSMAGITALLNQQTGTPQGQLNPRLYQLAANPPNQAFNDVTVATSGVTGCTVNTPSMCNNSTPSPTGLTGGLAGFLVNTGYDEVTGWGSINVGNLFRGWTATSPTQVSIASNNNPAPLGTYVTFTSYVTTDGTNPPTGNVTFYDGTTVIGMGTLNGSQEATTATNSLAAGTHSITAIYQGDGSNEASQSQVLTQSISGPTFNWVVNGSATGSVMAGQSVTYSLTATPSGGGVFASNVTFSCSGLPDPTVTCSFSPSSISAGLGQGTTTLTITTTGPNSVPQGQTRQIRGRRVSWMPFALPFAGIVVVGYRSRKLSRRTSILWLSISLILIGTFVACGGLSSSSPVTVVAGAGVPASLFPNDAAHNWPPQTAQFSATVGNASNTAVTWSVTTPNGGTINANGLYTAPTIAAGLPSTVTITATSVADPSKSAPVQETLTPTTVPGTYQNIMVNASESITVNSAPVTLVVN
jgi:subtilase family serine protease